MDISIQTIIRESLRRKIRDLKDYIETDDTRPYTKSEVRSRINEIEEVVGQELFTKRDVIEMLKPIVEVNDEIQERISIGAFEGIPSTSLKVLADLDWVIRNFGKEGNSRQRHLVGK